MSSSRECKTLFGLPDYICKPKDQSGQSTAFKEPHLGIFNTWTGSNGCQGWNGVICDPTTHRVADIVLRGESEDLIYEKAGRSGYMTGALSRSLCNLDKLLTLIVAYWKKISGEILASVTSLPNLRILELIRNKITGQISASIDQLSKLTVLNIADNQITGSIPASIVNLGKLKHLKLKQQSTFRHNPGRYRRTPDDKPSTTQQEQTHRFNPELNHSTSLVSRSRFYQ